MCPLYRKLILFFFIYIFVQAEEIERVVSEEEMEAAAITWSKELHDCPLPQDRQHPMWVTQTVISNSSALNEGVNKIDDSQ